MSSILRFWPFLLLVVSNIFMTFAWYGNLKFFKNGSTPLPFIILISWGIAFFEYCFMIPANRMASKSFDTAQLKIIQEGINTNCFWGVFCSLSEGKPPGRTTYYHWYV